MPDKEIDVLIPNRENCDLSRVECKYRCSGLCQEKAKQGPESKPDQERNN